MIKLMTGFGLMGFLMTAIGLIGLLSMGTINASTENLYRVQLSAVREAMSIQNNISMVRFWVLRAVTEANKARQDLAIGKVSELVEQNNESKARFGKTISSDEVRRAFSTFDKTLMEYRESRGKMIQLLVDGKQVEAMTRFETETKQAYEAVMKRVVQLSEITQREAQHQYESAQDLYGATKKILLAVNAVGVAMGLGFGFGLARFNTRHVNGVLDAAKKMSQGDMKARAEVFAQDDLGYLAKVFNEMGATLERDVNISAQYEATFEAVSRAQAVIEFNMDGTIIRANHNFLQAIGYSSDEIIGRHHRMFCDPIYANSAEYAAFWAKLNRGEPEIATFCRFAKEGNEIWIQASYNPISDAEGKPVKVVKFAIDVTEQRNKSAEFEGRINAIGKAQATIEFQLDGTVVGANENFLRCVGYRLEEVQGKHHRMFCDSSYASSPEYSAFWKKIASGENDTGIYRRLGKGGKEVWIQASYTPIFNANGKPYKVVKYVTDITMQKMAEVEKQAAQKVMEQLVTEAQMVLGRLAANDLTQAMNGTYPEDLEKIKDSINAVVHNLVETITTVREAVEAVTTGAEQITKRNEDLSQRTSKQASALEETSALMEEMTTTVKRNADNAKQANHLAVAAQDTADKGGAVTKKAVGAMGEINKSSKKIADIITIIDEIAFQSNLLALNAAVEAARAGEHGRGFAVVAAEVRSLAQRSATAAKEIKGLINESIRRVDDGSDLVNQSGKTLEEIVTAVKRVTDIIAEISAASQEQASGIDQVNKAIVSMDETTQQNAALVEETTSAAQSMKEQAKELMQQVTVFKVRAEGNPVVTMVKREPLRMVHKQA
ncbi:MAG: PAS domain S-box protein [Nitrospira sp.]|nr:PAS domain S-box protein [Nitrospira sp.]